MRKGLSESMMESTTERVGVDDRKPTVGLQMYSVRDECERDMLGTLEKIAEIGYTAIEMAGYFNAPPKQLKDKASAIGIQIPSTLVSLNFKRLGRLQSDFAKEVEIAGEIGVSYVSIPWFPLQESPSMNDVSFVCDVLRRCGEQVKEAGMKLALHNHENVWKRVEDKPAYERILDAISTGVMDAELDVGWMALAGMDMNAFLRSYGDRVSLVHLRNFKNGRMDTELDQGVLDYTGYLQDLNKSKAAYLFVEQESFEESSLESARRNYNFLERQGFC